MLATSNDATTDDSLSCSYSNVFNCVSNLTTVLLSFSEIYVSYKWLLCYVFTCVVFGLLINDLYGLVNALLWEMILAQIWWLFYNEMCYVLNTQHLPFSLTQELFKRTARINSKYHDSNEFYNSIRHLSLLRTVVLIRSAKDKIWN